jgi:hypothetical protein
MDLPPQRCFAVTDRPAVRLGPMKRIWALEMARHPEEPVLFSLLPRLDAHSSALGPCQDKSHERVIVECRGFSDRERNVVQGV